MSVSAGLHPSGKIEKWVLDILMKEDDITRYQCSSPIEELCKYDLPRSGRNPSR